MTDEDIYIIYIDKEEDLPFVFMFEKWTTLMRVCMKRSGY